MNTTKACLYIRVSTDEQADKGFSQRDQAERLQIYCNQKGIDVVRIIFEDYSAKTFDRPEWAKIISELQKTKGRCFDQILFTKWDRFSRNTADAYHMIRLLREYEVVPVAIEQPLDFAIPESKTILAVYLSMPEVENDRRALNVIYGMRRARKEGRWMGKALHGYKNKITEDGRKYIGLVEPDASLMKWCFEQIAENVFATEHIWMMAKEKGLKIGRCGFWQCLRNPVYCGRIVVPKFKDEEEYTVKGAHEALISESLFYKVQDVLELRSIKQVERTVHGLKVVTPDEFPLRGFMTCAVCGKTLTGSGSLGCRQRYYYYHCQVKCRQRFRIEVTHRLFENELRKFVPRVGIPEIFRMVVLDTFSDESAYIKNERREISNLIFQQQQRVNKSREYLLTETISEAEYNEIKDDSQRKIIRYEADLKAIEERVNHDFDIESMVNDLLSHMENVVNLYINANTSGKRHIVSSMFSGKWVFDGDVHRTTELNRAASLIYQLNNRLRHKKTGAKIEKNLNSGEVPESRFELPRRCQRQPLKLVRLPISPPGYWFCKYILIQII